MERAAGAELALQPDPPAMRFYQALGQREPQPGAFVAAGMRGVHLAEFDEDALHIFRPDADAGVGNAQVQLAVLDRGRNIHLAAIGEFHRVRQQVVEDLFDPDLVGSDEAEVGRQVELDAESLLIGGAA